MYKNINVFKKASLILIVVIFHLVKSSAQTAPQAKLNGNLSVDGIISQTNAALDSNDVMTKRQVDDLIINLALKAGVTLQGIVDLGYSPADLLRNGIDPILILGLEYEGGEICYLREDGTGIVAKRAYTFETDIRWGCQGEDISGATGIEIGSGKQNTIAIVNACREPNTAARLANDFVSESYDDWYLPSKDEVQVAFIQVGVLTAWSSTQANDLEAYFHNGPVAGIEIQRKDLLAELIVIRDF